MRWHYFTAPAQSVRSASLSLSLAVITSSRRRLYFCRKKTMKALVLFSEGPKVSDIHKLLAHTSQHQAERITPVISSAQTPVEEFSPTPAFPALQYLESVDEGGVAWRSGLRMGDFLIEVSIVDSCICAQSFI